MHVLNLGILAHVDAGKTSLTERLLYAAGVIDEIGRVDDGSTQTDFLSLERQRGITIKSAVVSFMIGDVTVNLIDTPGHPDFIAEVERVLDVLDGVVLVISAVEGVQPQTRVLMRALQRLRIPTLLYINKIDRRGADDGRVLHAIAERLTPAIIAMGSTHGLGTRGARFVPHDSTDPVFTTALAEVLADGDDTLLAAYVDDPAAVSHRDLCRELAAQTRRALVHPVFCGSAITGAGVDALMTAITQLLPAQEGDANAPASGTVFKVERGPAGERIAYVRMFAGTVHGRDRLLVRGEERKVTGVAVFAQGSTTQRSSVAAGEIAKVWGLGDIQIGDTLGSAKTEVEHHFSPPTLETVIVPRRAADKGALHVALEQLTEQDPLINLRQDDVRQETYVSLYGEVQKEVVRDTLAADFGVEVEFRDTTTICIERPTGSGSAVEVMPRGRSATRPFLATVGLRVDPAPVDSGVAFALEVELGSLPRAFMTAIDDAVHAALQQGVHGWRVTDCTVTLIRSGYAPRQSHAHATFDKAMSSVANDFRHMTPLVLMRALKRAGTAVCEPLHRFHLEIPTDTIGSVLPVLARLYAVPDVPVTSGSATALDGEIPAAHIHELQQQLPGLTRGEGIFESAFERYEATRGAPPTRSRSDLNPLDREEYLLRLAGRI